ncbi:hypothetical protein BS17DRAFT_654981, partial [Gyrodon lividus]
PLDHPGRNPALSRLAITRFIGSQPSRHRDRKNLVEAIQLYREALALRPPGHRAQSLDNIAGVLPTRFEQGGDGNDLEEAIQLHREAMTLRPPGHPDRAKSLDVIEGMLHIQFEQAGES